MADLDSPAPDSRDDFIHGVIQARGGSCASLPVLYVAVGRRLGYPMRLAKTARHLFARWDDPGGERFNIEISNAGGVDTPPDDHYLDWPMPIRGTPWEEVYRFRSLTPREELAMAWAKRGYCLRDNARRREAVDAFAVAWSLTPNDTLAEGSLQVAMGEWKATFPSWIERRQRLGIEWPPRLYPGLPIELEQDIIELAVYEHRLASEPTTECWTVVKPPFLYLETPHVL